MSKCDYNVIVIGGGSAGLVSAYMCNLFKAKTALIEKHKMGGDCLNTGCVPSKALIRAAHAAHEIKNASQFGIKTQNPEIDFEKVMSRVDKIIRDIEPHDSRERYEGLGISCYEGEGQIISPNQVKIGENIITTKKIIIATGARPLVPPIEGLADIPYLTSDNLWQLTNLPKNLTILGGGPIGCEMAQSFARLGATVTLVEMQPRILQNEDEDAAKIVEQSLINDGVMIKTNHKAIKFEKGRLITETGGKVAEIEFDHVLLALGRKPNVEGLGLEALGMRMSKRAIPDINPLTLQTSIPNIYVCGDVAGSYQFTHFAAHQAVTAALNTITGRIKNLKVNMNAIPWATFTDPELARVGLSETEAKQKNIQYEITKYSLEGLDRARADGSNQGFVKVLTPPGKDKILGVTIVGPSAGNLISEWTLAKNNNLGLKKILGTIHPYPTLMEANKFAASTWSQNHTPKWALHMLEHWQTLWR